MQSKPALKLLCLVVALLAGSPALGCGLTTDAEPPPSQPDAPMSSEVPVPADRVMRARRSLAAGLAHSCVRYRDNQLYCWGANAEGQLGNGSTTASPTANLVQFPPGTPRVVDVCAGAAHTCAVTEDKRLWCWGSAQSGRLGVQTADPTRPTALAEQDWLTVACGAEFTCGISDQGWLRCWGRDNEGTLGLSGAGDQMTPQRLGDGIWMSVEAGRSQACGVQSNGTLWCWGAAVPLGLVADEPQQLAEDELWRQVRVGGDRLCAERSDGLLRCWQRSSAVTVTIMRANMQVELRSPRLDLGDTHGCVILNSAFLSGVTDLASRQVGCWGDDSQGQRGDGMAQGSFTSAQQLDANATVSPVLADDIALGFAHSCVVDSADNVTPVRCAGSNAAQQLGAGMTASTVDTFVPVTGFPN